MRMFNRLPGFHRTRPGAERVILRGLPNALWSGTVFLCLPSIAIHAWAWMAGSGETPPDLRMIDIYAASAIILYWTILFTVAIAAFIVMVMKGPAYVADAYPLVDHDKPPCSP